MKKKPNIVFVLTDDQGYPPLGCHGHPFIKTPTGRFVQGKNKCLVPQLKIRSQKC